MWWIAPVLAANVAPPSADGPVHAVSPRHLVVTVGEDTPFSQSPSDWTLACGAEVRQAVSLSVRTRAVELLVVGWPYTPVVEHELTIGYDGDLPTGSCTVGAIAFDHDPDVLWTPSIRLNQVGATPGRARLAISWWAPVPVDYDAPTVRIVDALSGADVSTHALTRRTVTADDAYGNDYTRAPIWEVELPDLTAGTYYAVWDGVGRSWTFDVADDVWDAPFRIAFRGLYHQRCGTALDPALTAWSHGTCHTAPVDRSTADYQVVGEDAFSDLPAGATGELVDASGGYHDAADYDRNSGHLRIVDELVDLYELDPARHGRDDLGIPESGDGLPDLLDEAAWGLSTWRKLQTADGGVAGGVGTTTYPDLTEMPDVDDGVWYAYASDPVASYRYAGAAAKLGRALAAVDPAASADWIDSALRAWGWAEANPRGYDTRVPSVQAAAELLATTGDPSFDTVFRERGPITDPSWTLYDWDGEEWHEALYTYARAPSADPTTRDAAARALIDRALSWSAWADGSGWHLVKHPYAPITNGTATTPVGSGLLIRAWALGGGDALLEAAARGADPTLGANPSGWSWLTGVGDRPVLQPLHTPSLGDGLADPVPGITLYGPSYLTTGSDNVAVTLDAFEPAIDLWPLLERYADVAYVPNMNEFTVAENVGPTVFAFGALSAWTSLPDDTGEPPTDGGETTPDPTDDPEVPDDTHPDLGAEEGEEGCGCASSSAEVGPAVVLALGALRRRRRSRG